ncbi:MAG: ankyrin repeat domain-containing protein [Pseudomonadota bacterium]
MFNMIFKRLFAAACLCLSCATAMADPVTDFFRAVQMDDVDTVKAMMASSFDLNRQNPIGGDTAMILALREGSERVFRALLGSPAIALEATSPNGNTALMMAAYKRNQGAVLALLAKGAQVQRSGWTALHYAAASGDDAIVRILLEHHALIDSTAPYQMTALMIAAREGQESTAQLLLELGANPGLHNSEAMTAADIAERADKPIIAAAIRARQ